MKYPIMYRVGIYSCLAVLCVSVMFLVSLLNYSPFKSTDMRSAYYHGCNAGMMDKKTGLPMVTNCTWIANQFKDYLDNMDNK